MWRAHARPARVWSRLTRSRTTGLLHQWFDGWEAVSPRENRVQSSTAHSWRGNAVRSLSSSVRYCEHPRGGPRQSRSFAQVLPTRRVSSTAFRCRATMFRSTNVNKMFPEKEDSYSKHGCTRTQSGLSGTCVLELEVAIGFRGGSSAMRGTSSSSLPRATWRSACLDRSSGASSDSRGTRPDRAPHRKDKGDEGQRTSGGVSEIDGLREREVAHGHASGK